jgi:hypothetical protein
MNNSVQQSNEIVESLLPPKVDVDEHRKALFVGAKYQSYYKEKFDLMTAQQSQAGFNLAAFLFGVLWMFYRKMYAYGFMAIGLMFVVGVIEEIFKLSGIVSSVIFAIMYGVWGNSLYKHYVDKKIELIAENSYSASLDQQLQEEGGTSIWAALLLLGTAIALICLTIFFDP